ncbi:MAG: carbohydrate ABC transporter permease [Cyanobacteria bacterium]|nr:carbohydrate ABC transporter permease [Cyanobacteriota bacterium]
MKKIISHVLLISLSCIFLLPLICIISTSLKGSEQIYSRHPAKQRFASDVDTQKVGTVQSTSFVSKDQGDFCSGPVSKQSFDVQVALKKVATTLNARVAFGDNSDFQNKSSKSSSGFEWIPNPVVWSNFWLALSKINFLNSLLNTIYIAVFNIFGVVVASSLAAYAFSALEWKGRDLFFAITLATIMLPDMVLMVPQFILFKQMGWYGTMLPLIVPYFCGLPFYIFLLRQFFLTIPRDLADSARIDGANEFTIWKDIYVPLAKPALMVVGLFQFLISWNDLLKPSIFLIDETQYTLSLALQQYQSKLGGAEWGPLMAAVLIMIVPIVILFLLTQKYFVKGIAMSGLKES